ncbi:MAG: MlaD protein [Verrucomicrobiota bacterium]|jgi:ABC-type transporter Mla subunit MlaD
MALQDLTPQLRTRLSRMERTVGWFVLLATVLLVAGFCYYIYNTAARKGWFLQKAKFFTFTDSATGLKEGDPVMLMGMPAGQVTLIKPMDPYSPYNIYVEFELMDPNYGYMWTEGSRVKVGSGFLQSRLLEVTKGTNGHAVYISNPIEEATRERAKELMALGNWSVAEDVYDASGKSVLIPALKRPLDAEQLAQIFTGGRTNLWLANLKESRKKFTGVWNDQAGHYEHVTRNTKYWLLSDESPAVTERLERVADQVEKALPNFLRLTNQLAQILDNGVHVTSNLNGVAQTALPAAENLAAISAQLRGPGALGEWALPPGGPAQLATALTNANTLLLNTDTNLSSLVGELSRLLENLAGITSNLNSQVQANTNLVKEVSDAIVHTDDLIQGLKRHWLLRSAFKTPKTNAPPVVPENGMRAPNDPFQK